MTLILFKIKDFVINYWKYILVFLSPILLFFLFRKSDNTEDSQTENELNYNDFHTWFIRWSNSDNSIFWVREPREIFNDAKLVSIYLGTYKHHTQNTEDENRAVDVILKCTFSEYQALEYAYNKYFTENKDLTADLHAYLSSSQYEEVAPIIFA